MAALYEVLGASKDVEPPMRDVDGVLTAVRVRRIPGMHLLTVAGANADAADDNRLPPPDQPLFTRLSEPQVAELIERHVEYVNADGRPVHLPAPFVRHYHARDDNALPTIGAIVTLPMVKPDGTLLSGRGLDRECGIVFRIPCTAATVAEQARFLMDDWLCDVATDNVGKCTVISAGLTIIQRALLTERPVFFVTAGRRGG